MGVKNSRFILCSVGNHVSLKKKKREAWWWFQKWLKADSHLSDQPTPDPKCMEFLALWFTLTISLASRPQFASSTFKSSSIKTGPSHKELTVENSIEGGEREGGEGDES